MNGTRQWMFLKAGSLACRKQEMSFIELYTRFDGRISRASWWLGSIALLVPALLLLASLPAVQTEQGPRLAPGWQPVASLISLLLVIPQTALATKRFNDRGHPPWVAEVFLGVNLTGVVLQHFGLFSSFAAMSPLETVAWLAFVGYSLWVMVDNGFLKGTDGPNAYGPDPLE